MDVLLSHPCCCISPDPPLQSRSALCRTEEDPTGSPGHCGSLCGESRILSCCQVLLVMPFILAEVLLTFGLCLCRPFPGSPPACSQAAFTIPNQHRQWTRVCRPLYCAPGCCGSCFQSLSMSGGTRTCPKRKYILISTQWHVSRVQPLGSGEEGSVPIAVSSFMKQGAGQHHPNENSRAVLRSGYFNFRLIDIGRLELIVRCQEICKCWPSLCCPKVGFISQDVQVP